jgi:hypothetical protein
MTVKNGMPYLTATLESIAAQTFSDYEVLVSLIDSDDGTAAELARWIPRRLPGQVIPHGQMSTGAALAELVNRSQSEFCARIDADDVNEPGRLEQQIAFLRARPDIAVVGSRVRIIDELGRPTGVTFENPLENDDIVNSFLINNWIGHPSVVFRRNAVLMAGNYSTQDPIEDYDLWMRMACTQRLENLPAYLVRYRVHPRSQTQSLKDRQQEERRTQTFAANAPALFGLDSATARMLHQKRARCALWPALKIARHLAAARGISVWACLRRPSLLDGLRALTSTRDWLSLACFNLLDPRPLVIRQSLHRLRNRAIARMPFGPRMLQAVRARRDRRLKTLR